MDSPACIFAILFAIGIIGIVLIRNSKAAKRRAHLKKINELIKLSRGRSKDIEK